SRRRHTRSKRDWSSDVCSSDLMLLDDRSHGLPLDHLERAKTLSFILDGLASIADRFEVLREVAEFLVALILPRSVEKAEVDEDPELLLTDGNDQREAPVALCHVLSLVLHLDAALHRLVLPGEAAQEAVVVLRAGDDVDPVEQLGPRVLDVHHGLLIRLPPRT